MCERTSQCPECGKFTSKVTATINYERIIKVEGICKKHGLVDISGGSWAWENFDHKQED